LIPSSCVRPGSSASWVGRFCTSCIFRLFRIGSSSFSAGRGGSSPISGERGWFTKLDHPKKVV